MKSFAMLLLFLLLATNAQAGAMTCDFSNTGTDPLCETQLEASWLVNGDVATSANVGIREYLGNSYLITNQIAGRTLELEFNSEVSFQGGAFSTHTGTPSFNLFISGFLDGTLVGSAVLPAFKEEPPSTFFGDSYFGADFANVNKLTFVACITSSPCSNGFDFAIDNITIETLAIGGGSPVPEPDLFWLLSLGSAGVAFRRRRCALS